MIASGHGEVSQVRVAYAHAREGGSLLLSQRRRTRTPVQKFSNYSLTKFKVHNNIINTWCVRVF